MVPDSLEIAISASILRSNFEEWREPLVRWIDSINLVLLDDSDFGKASQDSKSLKKVENLIKDAKNRALGQVEAIEKLFGQLDEVSNLARQSRLQLDRQVRARKAEIKSELLSEAMTDIHNYVSDKGQLFHSLQHDDIIKRTSFEAAIKGKGTLVGMKTALRECSLSMRALLDAKHVRINRSVELLDELGSEDRLLFQDIERLVALTEEKLRLLIKERLHERDEARRKAEELRLLEESTPKSEGLIDEPAVSEAASVSPDELNFRVSPVVSNPIQDDSPKLDYRILVFLRSSRQRADELRTLIAEQCSMFPIVQTVSLEEVADNGDEHSQSSAIVHDRAEVAGCSRDRVVEMAESAKEMSAAEQRVSDKAIELLRRGTENSTSNFRKGQLEAILEVVTRQGRSLVVQRTGWGKSAVYFIATRLLRDQGRGPVLIVSPLLALMRNQIKAASTFGVELRTVNSATEWDEDLKTVSLFSSGKLDALIVSPERLNNRDFLARCLGPVAGSVSLLVIDEVHCISDWGYDFRPDYKRIKNLLQALPSNMPILGTTATANERVVKDVEEQLGSNIRTIRGALRRESLMLQNISLSRGSTRAERLAWLADYIPQVPGTGIIYVATRRDAKWVAEWLRSRGISAHEYYGKFDGMSERESNDKRKKLEVDLYTNRIKALVATSALGMGYDKPDLAFVIHYQSPGSIVSYYQQVGRAGRGIPEARGILFFGDDDDDIHQYFFQKAFPDEHLVEQLLSCLADSANGLTETQLLAQINCRDNQVPAALKFLAAESPSPVLQVSGSQVWNRTPVDYQLPLDTIRRRTGMKQEEWKKMQRYHGHRGCLMAYLAHELGDSNNEDCGRCSSCLPSAGLGSSYRHETLVEAGKFLQCREIVIKPRKKAGNKGDMMDRFPSFVASAQFEPFFGDLEAQPGRALCYWGMPGLGDLVREGKRVGSFDRALVEVSAELILENWKPNPAPQWITFVPSLTRPSLVANFAASLAVALNLPLFPVIRKCRSNEPQKRMQNTIHRCRNLDGVFEVDHSIPKGPVVLVDDVVDSRWTFAVVSALLIRSGSGDVFPFAVASAENAD